jgi:hypothetical protein
MLVSHFDFDGGWYEVSTAHFGKGLPISAGLKARTSPLNSGPPKESMSGSLISRLSLSALR